jgi:MFS family permease
LLNPPALSTAPSPETRYLPAALLLCVVFVVEGSAYGLLAPLLPIYRRQAGLTVGMAGLVTGAFTAGMLPASISIFIHDRRVAARRLTVAGLALMAIGSVAMAVAHSVIALILARVLQGMGSGAVFAGALRWLLAIVPASRRATWFGIGWGSLNSGSIVGPAVGGLAVRYGLAPVQIAVAATTTLLAVALVSAPHPKGVRAAAAGMSARSRFLASRRPLLFLTAPALAFGMANTLSPLRMADLGAGRNAVAAVFLGAGALSVCASPISGRWVDHSGPNRPLRVGLLLGALAATGLALADSEVGMAIGTIVMLGLANELAAVSTSSLVDTAASATGLDSASAALLPIVYAVFETLGAFVSGPLALAGAGMPFLNLAAVYAATAILPASRGRRV